MNSKQIVINDINGVLLVDKETGVTSHDVVNMARRKLEMKKIGHCGTIDPNATGLLMLVLGRGTKMQDLLMSEDKVYEGEITLGANTNTYDGAGDILEEKDYSHVTNDLIENAFMSYTGEFEQTPPMVSAIKKNGVPLYKLARQGITVERKPRSVKVNKYEIHDITLPKVKFSVHCSKGFYVRSYAYDIGEKLGTGGYISELRRLKSGNFKVEDAISSIDLKNESRIEIIKKILTLSDVSMIRDL